MLDLNIKVSGKTYRDLEEALQEVTRKIKGAYCEGYDSKGEGE